MKIVVFGANGPTGRLLTQQALQAGHVVTAVTRHPALFPFEHANLQVFQADVLDALAVERALAGQQAVLSTLGVPFSRNAIEVYSHGAANVMRAMKRHGVQRLACVSSSVMDQHACSDGGFVFNRIVQPLIVNTLGKTVYADMRRMEELVTNSELEWTIVRPSGLFETSGVTNYEVRENSHPGRFTSRADLADCMLRQISDVRWVRKAIGVATVTQQPNMMKLILKEAFQERPS